MEPRTNQIVTETLAGQYHSVFKVQGMNLDEMCEYQQTILSPSPTNI